MAKKKGSIQPSGGARLMASGRKPVQLGLTEEEMALIDRARDLAPRTKFITRAAVNEAKRILGEKP